MGLLDDAIREHLDLKRRRGADPAEIERAEREALGPVRRHYDEADAPFDDSEDVLAGGDALSDDAGDEWAVREGRGADPREPLAEYDEHDMPEEQAHWNEEDDRFPPGHPAPPAPADPSLHALDAETSEYDVAAEHAAEDEDVLEETPDFLQDTPDHDRLWFEQRPPRDFDFDG